MKKKNENHDIVTTHCFIHKAVLVSTTFGDEMKNFWMMLQ
jgi:hypothetical protein